MLTRHRRSIVLLIFNGALALLIQAATPAQPRLTDRNDDDHNSRQPLATQASSWAISAYLRESR